MGQIETTAPETALSREGGAGHPVELQSGDNGREGWAPAQHPSAARPGEPGPPYEPHVQENLPRVAGSPCPRRAPGRMRTPESHNHRAPVCPTAARQPGKDGRDAEDSKSAAIRGRCTKDVTP